MYNIYIYTHKYTSDVMLLPLLIAHQVAGRFLADSAHYSRDRSCLAGHLPRYFVHLQQSDRSSRGRHQPYQ